jgi:hypothetical protein
MGGGDREDGGEQQQDGDRATQRGLTLAP